MRERCRKGEWCGGRASLRERSESFCHGFEFLVMFAVWFSGC